MIVYIYIYIYIIWLERPDSVRAEALDELQVAALLHIYIYIYIYNTK